MPVRYPFVLARAYLLACLLALLLSSVSFPASAMSTADPQPTKRSNENNNPFSGYTGLEQRYTPGQAFIHIGLPLLGQLILSCTTLSFTQNPDYEQLFHC